MFHHSTFSYCLHNSFVKLENNYILKKTKCLYVNIYMYIHYSMLYNCTLICFQNQPSANPIWVLVNSCVKGPMLINFKKIRSALLNNDNKDGVGLPTDQRHRHQRHCYRFKPYPQRHRFPVTYDSMVGSVQLSLCVLHAIHIFLHGHHYTIMNHLEPVQNSCNYKFKSYKNGKMHMECIGKLTLMLYMYLLIF